MDEIQTYLAGELGALALWLADSILVLGYPGLIFLMAVESSLIPFPSEVVVPPAGFLVYEGRMSWIGVILSGAAGSLLGALFNYWLALRLGRAFIIKYGKFIFLRPESLEKAERFFARHGGIATLAGRLIPVIRQLISLPAGAARMPLGRFCLFTAVGSGLWVAILALVGWLIGRNRELLGEYMRSASLLATAGALGMVMVYFLLQRRRPGGRN
ncbi:MAG: DedA family protein [Planctomycetota bacterium]|jgi:membrane protein DedA with SNARE-associated domain|nr:DedA family protein [Planctomycetota bacterium]